MKCSVVVVGVVVFAVGVVQNQVNIKCFVVVVIVLVLLLSLL